MILLIHWYSQPLNWDSKFTNYNFSNLVWAWLAYCSKVDNLLNILSGMRLIFVWIHGLNRLWTQRAHLIPRKHKNSVRLVCFWTAFRFSPALSGAEPFLFWATLPRPFPFNIHPQPSSVVSLVAEGMGPCREVIGLFAWNTNLVNNYTTNSRKWFRRLKLQIAFQSKPISIRKKSSLLSLFEFSFHK